MKNYILLFLLFIISASYSQTEKQNLIIDTDMSLDDIRAITYFSKLYDYNIKAYISTEGVQSANKGAFNLRKYLKALKVETPVYQGMISKVHETKARKLVYDLNWKGLPDVDINITAIGNFVEKIQNSKEKYTYIALGPLTNLAYLLKKIPNLKDRLNAVYFFGGIPEYYDKDTDNYKFDSTSVNYVLEQDIPFYAFVSKRLDLPVFDHRDWNNITSAKNLHVNTLNLLFQKSDVLRQMFIDEDVYRFYSDMIPVYMENNLFARFDKHGENLFVMRKWDKKLSSTRYYLRMKEKYAQNLKPKNNVSFREFPVDIELYSIDIGSNIDFLIQTYGTEEFRSIILNNELHNYINSFSIIGAKMGVRARELLKAEYDHIDVISNLPDELPESYTIDGIQISTGATPGNGKLKLDDESKIRAEFFFGTKKVTLELKEEVYEKILSIYKEANETMDKGSDEYKEFMRRTTIDNWINYNRKDIFIEEIEEVEPRRN